LVQAGYTYAVLEVWDGGHQLNKDIGKKKSASVFVTAKNQESVRLKL
jgi:hypothetical protein